MIDDRATGCREDPADAVGTCSLDELLASSGAAAVPATLDLGHLVKRVHDQGPFGLCVGFGVGRAAENYARQNGSPDLEDLSYLAVYKQARAIARASNDPFDGTTTSAALYGLERGGFLFAKDMPYDPSKRMGSLPLAMGQKGLRKAGVKSARLVEGPGPSLQQATCRTLVGRNGVVGGWRVNDSFKKWKPSMGPFAGNTGSTATEGHCMAVLDFKSGLPRLVNSWGKTLGDGGIWTVTWEFLMEAMSLWAINFVPQV